MKQLHVTTLSKFNKCPGDYMYNTSQPELKNTYKGDVLNTAVLSIGPLGPYVKWYAENIDSDFTELERLKKVILEARAYAHLTRATVEQKILKEIPGVGCYQETKMVIPYSDDYCIVGSVDFVYNNAQEIKLRDGSTFTGWVIEDFKYSTHNYYNSEDIIKFDCQRVVYPLMLMNFFGVEEVLFRFNVRDKKSCKQAYCAEQVMKKADCMLFLDDVMTRFAEAEKKKNFPNCNSQSCFYCGPLMRSAKRDDSGFVF